MKTQNELVAEIHNEFDAASENLLNEAKELIKKDAISEKLKTVGFTSIPRVKRMDEINDAKRMVETIEYYQQRYPNYKFITDTCVRNLCEKHELYLGDSMDFIGDIPDENISDILKFKCKKEDLPSDQDGVYSGRLTTWGGGSNFDRLFLNNGTWAEKQSYSNRGEPNYMIVAPKNMFNMRNMEIKDGYKIVLDPIVLKCVKGGYLIVTKWGKEGEDATLVNEKLN